MASTESPYVNQAKPARVLTQEQYERYAPWFENARLLRELLAELEALSLQTARDAEGWPPDDA
jgi:hypothetical protein